MRLNIERKVAKAKKLEYNELVTQSELRKIAQQQNCPTKWYWDFKDAIFNCTSKETKIANLFCFQEKQASRAKTSHSQALLVLKKTKDILLRLEPRDLKVPKERRGKTTLEQVGWITCDGEEHHVPMVPRSFIKVRIASQDIRSLRLHSGCLDTIISFNRKKKLGEVTVTRH